MRRRLFLLALLLAATPCMAASGLSIEAGAAQAGGSYEFTLGSEELGDWSRVRWPLDGVLMTGAIKYDHGISEKITARYEVGMQKSLTMSGTGQDWDWRPWEREGLSDYSETESDADLFKWELVAGMAVDVTPTLACMFSIGYQQLEVDFEDRNLDAWYDYGTDVFTADGLAATYALAASGPFFGIGAQWQVDERLRVFAEARYSPSLELEGEGEWIRAGKHFDQKIDATGLEVRVRPLYQLTSALDVALQYVHATQESDGAGRQWGTEGATSYDAQMVMAAESELSYWGAALIWRP